MLPPAVFGEVQADGRGAAGEGGADVDEVAVAVGACPQDGVGKNDGIALGPGDLAAEGGAVHRLVRGAGPDGGAAHLLVGVHELGGPLGQVGRAEELLRVHQVKRTHVEGGGHNAPGRRPPPAARQSPARLAVVEAAVNVGRFDVEQFGGAVDVTEPLNVKAGHPCNISILIDISLMTKTRSSISRSGTAKKS
jgi:hypothetical protein